MKKQYIDIDGNVFFYELNMSHDSTADFEDYESDDSISVETEDSYDTESLCSNDSYESIFIDYCKSTNDSTKDDTEDEFYLK